MLHFNFTIHWSILLLLIVFLVLVIIFLVWYFTKEEYHYDPYVEKQWKEIQEMWDQERTSAYKLAIVEADKLLDYVFKKKHFAGKDFAERLRWSIHKYPYLKELWFAHNIRNDIVHKSHFELSSWTAKKALRIYYRSLKTLGYLK